MKNDVSEPSVQSNVIQKINVTYFEDTSNFIAKTRKIKSKDLNLLIEKVLYSDRV
jgi:hypothetical protein